MSLLGLLTGHWTLAWPPTATAVLAGGAYLWAARRTERWPWQRTAGFLAGVIAVLAALESGLGFYDDTLLSVHMEQHLVLLELAPILLLSGRPFLLAMRVLPRARARALARALATARPRNAWVSPICCLLVFWVVVSATHLPGFYDATLSDPTLHEAEHLLYLLAGLLVWWPILGEHPRSGRRLGGFLQLAYVLASMLPMEAIGSYLSRAPSVVYHPYALSASSPAAAVLDQQHAGAIMWVAGGVIATAVVLFTAIRALVEEERRQRVRDAHAARLAGGLR